MLCHSLFGQQASCNACCKTPDLQHRGCKSGVLSVMVCAICACVADLLLLPAWTARSAPLQ